MESVSRTSIRKHASGVEGCPLGAGRGDILGSPLAETQGFEPWTELNTP